MTNREIKQSNIGMTTATFLHMLGKKEHAVSSSEFFSLWPSGLLCLSCCYNWSELGRQCMILTLVNKYITSLLSFDAECLHWLAMFYSGSKKSPKPGPYVFLMVVNDDGPREQLRNVRWGSVPGASCRH